MFIDNIFSWRPIEDQWLITGFNPEYKGEKANAKNQVMIGSVDFSKYNEYDENGEVINKMYEALKGIVSRDTKKSQYMIFDDTNKTVWICWYDGVLK